MHKCLPRDAIHSAVFAVVRRLSVRLFVTLIIDVGLSIETAKITIKLFHRLVAPSF